MMSKKCNLCPRKCGVDRDVNLGFCGVNNKIKIARAALHNWEEPCISGTRGSGAVFFCGCNLKCVYCQNADISHGDIGCEISKERLAEIFLELQEKGAHNINLVTPTHFICQIADVLKELGGRLKIPVVYNSGGYESESGLNLIGDYVNIYLTDIKYADDIIAKKYSFVSDYSKKAIAALGKMLNMAGKPVFDSDGIMRSGVIVRHLILPSHRKDSIELLHRLAREFGADSFILSLMSQFTPNGRLKEFPELSRRVTSFEYKSVTDTALELGFKNMYIQERSSASSEYTPPFDLTGVY